MNGLWPLADKKSSAVPYSPIVSIDAAESWEKQLMEDPKVRSVAKLFTRGMLTVLVDARIVLRFLL